MANYTFGANIIENLTTGMYKSSQVIFREYIQNACDAIDKAVAFNILKDNEGKIEIWIDAGKRLITIEDNGTGIPANEFEIILQSIAQSNKKIDSEKGFRGIGRLCGLAYCRELIFSTTTKDENIISIMKIDAQKLRSRFYGKIKYSAQEVLENVITVDKVFSEDIKDEHWFKVEMIDINPENEVLLNIAIIRDYLSFVAPVEYRNYFSFDSKIYDHAATLNFKIDEYRIYLNGEQIIKKYKTDFRTSKGYDEIFDVSFHDFYDKNNRLIAWSWIGLSKFKAVIKPDDIMRSIRLRKGNIQIGDADTLQDLFREERGIHYFIGEVFVVDKNLIPNSQRDYFIENTELRNFEEALSEYFNELRKIYYSTSIINSAVKSIESREVAEEKFRNQVFISKNHRDLEEEKLIAIRKKAIAGSNKIKRRQAEALLNPQSALAQVINKILEKPDNEQKVTPILLFEQGPIKYIGNTKNFFPKLNEREQKLVCNILDVIRKNTNDSTFEKLQDKIIKAVNK